MVGTIIIGVIGYSLSVLFAYTGLFVCPRDYRRAKERGDLALAKEEVGTAFGTVAISIVLAVLTRWLVGGSF